MAPLRSVAGCLSVVLMSGCALGITAPAPNRPAREVPRCDTGKGLVAVDGLWATLFGVAALGAIANGEGGPGLAVAGVSALFIASAVRGNNAADACTEELSAFASQRPMPPLDNDAVATQPEPKPRVGLKMRPTATPTAQPVQPVQAQDLPDEQPPVERPHAVVTTTPKPRDPPKPKPPAAAAEPDHDDWSSFWKELP